MKLANNILILLLLCCISCQKWDLERIDFIEVMIINSETVSLSEIRIEAELVGLNDLKIIQHGFVWSSLDSIPERGDLSSQEINLGGKNGNGIFNAILENLSLETNYFIRAFVASEEEIFYSNSILYNNKNEVEIGTGTVKAIIGSSNALAKGSISGLSQNEVIQQYGHCWSSINPLPEIFDNSNSLGDTIGNVAVFNSVISNLTPGETYFIRPYAIIAGIVLYGEVEFLTKGNYWVERGGLPDGDRGVYDAEFFSIDGKGYFVLGIRNGASNELWEYTPEDNTWKKLSPFPGIWRKEGFALSKGRKIYIGLGSSITIDATYYSDMWEYDIDTDTWTEKAHFPEGLRRSATSMKIEEKLYMAFGADLRGTTDIRYDEIWEFEPDWDNGPSLPKGRWSLNTNCPETRRFLAGSFTIDDVGYILGGAGLSNAKNELWGFHPNDSDHCQIYNAFPSFERHRFESIMFSDGKKGYYGCGKGDNPSGDFWQFDPLGVDENSGLRGKWVKIEDFANGGEASLKGMMLAFTLNERIFVGFGKFTNNNGIPPPNMLWEYIADE